MSTQPLGKTSAGPLPQSADPSLPPFTAGISPNSVDNTHTLAHVVLEESLSDQRAITGQLAREISILTQQKMELGRNTHILRSELSNAHCALKPLQQQVKRLQEELEKSERTVQELTEDLASRTPACSSHSETQDLQTQLKAEQERSAVLQTHLNDAKAALGASSQAAQEELTAKLSEQDLHYATLIAEHLSTHQIQQSALDTLTAETDALRTKCTQLQASITQLNHENDFLSGHNSLLGTSFIGLTSGVESIDPARPSSRSPSPDGSQDSPFNETLRAGDSALDLSTSFDSSVVIDSKASQIQELQAQLEETQRKLALKEAELGRNAQEYMGAQREKDSLTFALSNTRQELSTLRNEIQGLDCQEKAFEANLQRYNEVKAALQTKTLAEPSTSSDPSSSSSKKQLLRAVSQPFRKAAMRTLIKAAPDSEVALFKEAGTLMQQEIDALKGQLEAAHAAKVKAVEQLRSMRHQRETEGFEVVSLNGRVQTLEMTNTQLKKQNDELQLSLQRQLAEMEKENVHAFMQASSSINNLILTSLVIDTKLHNKQPHAAPSSSSAIPIPPPVPPSTKLSRQECSALQTRGFSSEQFLLGIQQQRETMQNNASQKKQQPGTPHSGKSWDRKYLWDPNDLNQDHPKKFETEIDLLSRNGSLLQAGLVKGRYSSWVKEMTMEVRFQQSACISFIDLLKRSINNSEITEGNPIQRDEILYLCTEAGFEVEVGNEMVKEEWACDDDEEQNIGASLIGHMLELTTVSDLRSAINKKKDQLDRSIVKLEKIVQKNGHAKSGILG